MSSNISITDNKHGTPELRFPSFEGEWEVKTLGDVFSRIRTKNSEDNKNVLTISAQYGLVSQTDFFNKSVAASDVTGYYLLEKGDFAYNKSSSSGFPVGVIKPLKLYEKGVVSTLYICFRCNEPKSIGFWEQYFNAGVLDKEIQTIAQEGARNHGLLNVPTEEFFQLKVMEPTLPEQKKIAECLSSLDDEIAAESDRLSVLKDHKKGLMQQLFPQKGQSRPSKRFPGFSDDWSWTNGNILFEAISNKNHNSDLPILALTQDQGAVPRDAINYTVQVSEKSIEGYKVVEVDDFIISLRSFEGGIEYSRYKGLCSPAYIVLRKRNKKLVSDFYRIYFKSYNFIQELNKNLEGIRDGKMVSYKQFSEISLPVPPIPEQQKIADCLSSLDDEIQAQQQKVNALKEHKRALMQKLFPIIK